MCSPPVCFIVIWSLAKHDFQRRKQIKGKINTHTQQYQTDKYINLEKKRKKGK